jgi:hypothetical protein
MLKLDHMLSKVSNPPAGFDELTLDEKLDYVESLWDRTREGQAGSRHGRSWDDFREELRTKLRQRRSTP